MRIVSIITSLTSGGAETLVAGLSAEFSALGHESAVVTLCDAATLGNSMEAEANLRDRIERPGGRVISLGLGRQRNPVKGWLGLRRIFREYRPETIHAHTVRALPMLGWPRRGRRVILTHHNSQFNFNPALLRAMQWQLDGIVAISNEIRTILAGYIDKPIIRIPNAPAPGIGVPAARSHPARQPSIISVGAISDQKNYPLLLEVARLLPATGIQGPSPVFRIAGAGAGLGQLRRDVRAIGLEDRVEFLGERLDVPDLLRSGDLFLNTSRYEGLPIAMLEAMTMALPIVATDVTGNRELVGQGKTGLLAPPDDPAGIASAIARVLNTPELYRSLSAGALKAVKAYSMERIAQSHLAFYSGRAPDADGTLAPKVLA